MRINEQNKSASLPKAWGVLYTKPNPDDSRKMCANCMMWVRDNKCVIHAKDVEVTESMICGYHVFGKPMDEWMDHPGMQPVEAETSGLDTVEGGTSCDVCEYYEKDTESTGKCWAVAKDGDAPVEVDAKGCCARWESSPDGPQTIVELLKKLRNEIGAIKR